ncbi:MAG TPA: energy-coupling factor transporter transmembrane component T [Beutenbergiaceae bacterium]|nr:energy-coupling factor transporter transmembrane component T [Beutenbergiaceae bacterium]
MAAFVSLDPEKLSDALLAMRFPPLVSFAVSYGYRMLPILIEEFSTVFEGYRLRQAPPARRGILGWRIIYQWVSMAVMSFYPIFLNTARSVRTTVEALEARGFNHAAIDARSRKIRLAYLRFKGLDYAVVAGSVTVIALAYWAGVQWPVYRL